MSFLSDYRDFCSGLEVPPSYNIFCGLVALSAMTKRRVFTMKGDYIRIYPNLYVILVGPPGLGKNTAMENCENLLHFFKLPVSAESVTREKLILDINAQESVMQHMSAEDKYRFTSPYTVFATELSEFLGAGGIGMISFLTDLYSRNLYEYRTKNKGSVFVNGPFLNLIAGTTPDWITTYLKDDIISGGFSRRCLFIYETSRYGCVPLPKITPAMRAAWARVLERGEAISKLHGQFEWTKDATDFFCDWYPSRLTKTDPNLSGYYETKDIQMLKIAMLVAMSEGDGLTLQRSHMLAALELLSLAEQNLSRVFQGIGRNELAASTVKVLDVLNIAPLMKKQEENGDIVEVHGLPRKQLDAALWNQLQAFELDAVLQHLRDTDKIGTATMNNREYVYLRAR